MMLMLITTPDIIQLQSNIRDALREKKWDYVGKIPRIWKFLVIFNDYLDP